MNVVIFDLKKTISCSCCDRDNDADRQIVLTLHNIIIQS